MTTSAAFTPSTMMGGGAPQPMGGMTATGSTFQPQMMQQPAPPQQNNQWNQNNAGSYQNQQRYSNNSMGNTNYQQQNRTGGNQVYQVKGSNP